MYNTFSRRRSPIDPSYESLSKSGTFDLPGDDSQYPLIFNTACLLHQQTANKSIETGVHVSSCTNDASLTAFSCPVWLVVVSGVGVACCGRGGGRGVVVIARDDVCLGEVSMIVVKVYSAGFTFSKLRNLLVKPEDTNELYV
ncbi:hypothetical protein Tco_1085974 [Tanacetum coccineum]